ncbi:thioesterase family protein [Evtepia sp.]|uniref:thioesterase family protein n=1 Tax=Evtepia sp. TaxID=2773933 RepID=UPI003F1731A3
MLQPGISAEVTFPVTNHFTAKSVGSGALEVLATPIMIAKMEQAAWTAVAPHLEEGAGTVGTLMNVQHVSATPVGMEVTCKAELTAVEGRKLVYRVTAWDAKGPIGEGVHERAVIQNDRFLSKARKKLEAGE